MPLSDGAGVVVAVGFSVSRFQIGDRVATLFHQDHLAGPIDAKARDSALGSSLHGVLREYGVFSEQGLVSVPGNLNLLEAASLPCAALTAWSALYGLEGRALKPGDTVLTEGTGGVSNFAIQVRSCRPKQTRLHALRLMSSKFAKSAGAKVIATTSSDEKAKRLRDLGADFVINYKENPEWGQLARGMTPNDEGVSLVVEVGGPNTLRQVSALCRTQQTPLQDSIN